MEKYKLVKCYPGYKKLGMIAVLKEGSVYFPELGGNAILRSNVENNPEFWEKVVELDYKVLEYKVGSSIFGKFDGHYYYKTSNGPIKDHTPKIHHSNIPSDWTIHSIRRKSDGEIFTVGDDMSNIYHDGFIKNILAIEPWKGNKIKFKGYSGYLALKNAKHSKKPLFRTEDGVDIYKGDEFYFVASANFGVGTLIATEGSIASCALGRFADKELAHKRSLFLKPKFSEKDMMKFQAFIRGDGKHLDSGEAFDYYKEYLYKK